MVRVLYFTGAYRPDSMVSHTHGDLVAALRARGTAVEMLTAAPPDQREAVRTAPDRHGTAVTYLRIPAGLRERPARFWSGRRWQYVPFLTYIHTLRRYLTPDVLARYDVVQVGMAFPYGAIFRRALAGRAHPPVIITITGGDIATGERADYGYGRTPTTRRALRDTFAWAALVQANSPQSARVAAERFACPPGKIAVQPPQSPVAPVPRDELPAFRAAARARLHTEATLPPARPEGTRVLLGLGRMVPIKGFDDAIRALPAIRAACGDVAMLFVGPTRDDAARAYAASLTALARSLGVGEHVRVRPQIAAEDVPVYLAAADIVLVPSLYDGLNKTGIEGAAVGTPVLISDAAGLADYVREDAAGIVIPPRDPAALAAAAVCLLTDAATWEAASRGASAMSTRFTLDRTADGVIALYERVSRAAH